MWQPKILASWFFDKCIWQICEEEVFIQYTVGVNKQTKKT